MSHARLRRSKLSDSGSAGSPSTGYPGRLLLLLPTATYRAAAYLDSAADLGLEVVVGAPFHPPLAGDGTLEVPVDSLETALDTIERRAFETPFDAIFGVDEAMAKVAAHAARRLGLNANPTSALDTLCDKLRFRQFLAHYRLNHPEFWEVDFEGRPVGSTGFPSGGPTFPCVLKPRTLRGSRGVIRVDQAASLGSTAARIAGIQTTALPGKAAPQSLVLERFLPGPEVALEGLVVDGVLKVLALFDKPGMSNGPYFEETVYVAPSRLPRSVQLACAEAVQAVLTALGLYEGPIHAELRCDGNQATLIEMAPRTIGGQCAAVLQLGGGPSLESVVLRHALGIGVPCDAPLLDPAGVMMIPIPGPGRLVAVDGLNAARQVAGVQAISIAVAPGRWVSPPPEGGDYLGFIFADGPTPAAVETSLYKAHRELRVEIADAASSSRD